MSRSNLAHLTGQIAVPLSSARRLALKGADAWALGAPGTVCLLHGVPLAGGQGDAYAFTCVTIAQAEAGLLVSTAAPIPGYPGMTLLTGLLPDYAKRVRIDLAGPRHRYLAVEDNGYTGIVGDPRSMSFRVGAIKHTLALPSAHLQSQEPHIAGP